LNILPSFDNTINLNTAVEFAITGIIWVGGCVAGFFSGFIIDIWGRKAGMAWAVYMTSVGIILQSAAQDPAMFLVGRFIVGVAVGLSSVACPTYVSEVSQLKWRAFSLGFYYDFWYGGGIIASAITYGTSHINSSWARRISSIL
jgi:MFS family permease